MSRNANSFFEDLLKNSYSEKTASEEEVEKEDVKKALEDAFSTDEIEALAEEIGTMFMTKEAGNNIMTQKEHEDEKNRKSDESVDDADQDESENPDDEDDATESEEAEESKTKAEKEKMVNSVAKKLEKKTASDILEDMIKESAEEDEEMIKEAYEIAENNLAEAGYTVADYIFTKIADEDLTLAIADKAEKLAFVSGRNTLQVADDIMLNMAQLVDSESSEE